MLPRDYFASNRLLVEERGITGRRGNTSATSPARRRSCAARANRSAGMVSLPSPRSTPNRRRYSSSSGRSIRRFRCCWSIPVGCSLAHRDAVVAKLGLIEVRSITPDPNKLEQRDPNADLWSTNPNACCAVRKIEPLADALVPFAA